MLILSWSLSDYTEAWHPQSVWLEVKMCWDISSSFMYLIIHITFTNILSFNCNVSVYAVIERSREVKDP